MSGVVFANKSVTYDGNAFSIDATNLPTGVTASYENNGKTEAGVYTIIAKFTGNENYNAISDMTATLTIKNALLVFNTNTENQIANDVMISAPDGIDPTKELVVEEVEESDPDEGDGAEYLLSDEWFEIYDPEDEAPNS